MMRKVRWRINGPVYLLLVTIGRLDVCFWDKAPIFWWHLSWGGDIFAFHLTAGPLIITVEPKESA